MILGIVEEFNEMLTELDKKYYSDIEQLKSCPQGRMIRTRSHGKDIIMHVTNKDNSRIRKTITKDADTQMALAKSGVLNEELRRLEIISSKLSSIKDEVLDLNTFDRMRFAIENYPWLDSQQLNTVCYKDVSSDEWSSRLYEKADYMTEMRIHYTSRGLAVRSKSELLIAEMLYKYDIPFRYEPVIYITDVIKLIPDFLIRRKDGKLFYWEHEGMVNLKKYAEWQRVKSELYSKMGIVPWDNLIITYDTKDGCIDLRLIESEIVNKLLI